MAHPVVRIGGDFDPPLTRRGREHLAQSADCGIRFGLSNFSPDENSKLQEVDVTSARKHTFLAGESRGIELSRLAIQNPCHGVDLPHVRANFLFFSFDRDVLRVDELDSEFATRQEPAVKGLQESGLLHPVRQLVPNEVFLVHGFMCSGVQQFPVTHVVAATHNELGPTIVPAIKYPTIALCRSRSAIVPSNIATSSSNRMSRRASHTPKSTTPNIATCLNTIFA